MKKNVAFTLISFAVLKWHECLSFQLPFELTVEIPVQLHLELEVNLLVHNVIEREIEREKVQMKPPMDRQWFFESIHTLLLRWSNYKDIIDSLHCMYGNINNNMKYNIEPKQMQKKLLHWMQKIIDPLDY